MNAIDLKEILLEELDYAHAPGFISSLSWSNDRPIPDVNSAYFVGDVPVIYFSQLEEVTPTRVWELYQRVWNQSKVPLLYVISRHDIWIYNIYAEPARTPDELIPSAKDHSG